MDKIFDPYFTTKPHGKGTGLGLSTVLGIIKEHYGGVKVYSEVGLGTTFSIYLPKAETNSIYTTQTISESLQGTEQLLIVDDEESILEISKISLESLGYNVEVTASPIAALDMIRLNPEKFNLIITDINMAEMNGIDFAKEVNSINNQLPIILTTGYSSTPDNVNLNELNVKELLLKPVPLNEMATKIRNILDS